MLGVHAQADPTHAFQSVKFNISQGPALASAERLTGGLKILDCEKILKKKNQVPIIEKPNGKYLIHFVLTV